LGRPEQQRAGEAKRHAEYWKRSSSKTLHDDLVPGCS
jgi:hypothetical protein